MESLDNEYKQIDVFNAEELRFDHAERFQIVAETHFSEQVQLTLLDNETGQFYRMTALELFQHDSLLTQLSISDLRLFITSWTDYMILTEKANLIGLKQ